MKKKQKQSWALVLSGGGARGLAHIGVLKGLAEAGFPEPSLVVGTSMGAIVGGLYASGMNAGELARFAVDDFNIYDYMDSFVFRVNGPMGKVLQTGQALATLASRPGIDTGNRVLELLEGLTGGKSFAETRIPFRCNALDLLSGREIVFRSGSVARAIRASMSFPLFFEPLEDEGMCLVDGGLLDNLPVSIARQEGAKRIMAVNVNRFTKAPEDIKNGPQVIFRAMECLLHNQQKREKAGANLTLDVYNDATPFSFFRQKEFIALGEEAVRNNRETLERFFAPGLWFF